MLIIQAWIPHMYTNLATYCKAVVCTAVRIIAGSYISINISYIYWKTAKLIVSPLYGYIKLQKKKEITSSYVAILTRQLILVWQPIPSMHQPVRVFGAASV
jgi:hypothetical protein